MGSLLGRLGLRLNAHLGDMNQRRRDAQAWKNLEHSPEGQQRAQALLDRAIRTELDIPDTLEDTPDSMSTGVAGKAKDPHFKVALDFADTHPSLMIADNVIRYEKVGSEIPKDRKERLERTRAFINTLDSATQLTPTVFTTAMRTASTGGQRTYKRDPNQYIEEKYTATSLRDIVEGVNACLHEDNRITLSALMGEPDGAQVIRTDERQRRSAPLTR